MTKNKTKVKTYQEKAIKLVAIGKAMQIYDIGRNYIPLAVWHGLD